MEQRTKQKASLLLLVSVFLFYLHPTLLSAEKSISTVVVYAAYMCVCVCAPARARARAHVCMFVCAFLLSIILTRHTAYQFSRDLLELTEHNLNFWR